MKTRRLAEATVAELHLITGLRPPERIAAEVETVHRVLRTQDLRYRETLSGLAVLFGVLGFVAGTVLMGLLAMVD